MITVSTDMRGVKPELEDVARVFFTSEDVEIAHFSGSGDVWRDSFTVRINGETESCAESTEALSGGALFIASRRKRFSKMTLYRLLKRMTGRHPPWGGLTGVRPMRLFYEGIESGLQPEDCARGIEREFDVSPQKASVLSEIYYSQKGVREVSSGEYDAYIGIPFCKTRCSYCSFATPEAARSAGLMRPYVEALGREIEAGAKDMRKAGMRLRALYIGGGTPTALEPDMLERVIAAAKALGEPLEFTVEAGRPDTITDAHLEMLGRHSVTRLSINPQSMNQATLDLIGRSHTPAQIIKAFEMAARRGFSNINADIIAALPGERALDFQRTLRAVIAIAPASVTVHTLALKRSSELHRTGFTAEGHGEAALMVDMARDMLKSAGYAPYYIYRQKHMAGNLENVGYSMPGAQCLYNIGNMEETAPVLAFGAGAITKWLFAGGRRIERAPNIRDIRLYIDKIDDIIARKRKIYNMPEEKQ